MFPDALKQLLEEFERSSVRELHIRTPGFELYLSTDPAAGRSAVASAPPRAPSGPQAATIAPAPSPTPTPRAPDPAGAGAALPKGAIIVSAPNLGTFYRAPKPGAANYVELGAKVSAGDELCLIEVMKLFTAVRATEGGTVHSILVEDGAMVEGGQPLLVLVRD